MADLDDALVNYLTDKYSADAENGENDAEMDDIPDSASVGGRSEGSSDESDSESEASEDSDSSTDTVMDNKAAKDEVDKQRRKEKREERRAKKAKKEEKRKRKAEKKEKKERKRKHKKEKSEKDSKRRKRSREERSESKRRDERSSSSRRDERERSSSRRRDDRERSSSRRRDDREGSSSRRRSPSPTGSTRSFRSVHADFKYGKSRSSSRARSRSPDRYSSRSERPYKKSSSSSRRSKSPDRKRSGKAEDYGQLGNRAIPPPSDLYTMKEHKDSDDSGDDDDKDGAYSGTGLSKEDKMKLLEIAKKNALNVHGGLNKNESIAMRHGGLTIEKLTEKCQRVADGKEDPVTEDIPDDMLNHPFEMVEKAPEQLTFRPIFLKPKQVDPLALPADASMAALTKSFPVSAGIQHREVINDYDIDKEGVGEWTEGGAGGDSDDETATVENGEENGKDKKMSMADIQGAIADRIEAMRKLQENPDDNDAMEQMNKAQQQLAEWNASGQAAEETKIVPMSWADLSSGNPAWAKKDQFHVARKVEGLGKKLLEKMGWSEGMGLGKNAQGNAEPLVLDFKINREGLSSTNESADGPSFMGRKGFAGGIVKDLSGKHPVSALMEVCSKRRWGQPEFTLLTDPGAGNNRSYLYKVRVYDTEYQPACPSLNKKTAKAASATVALQALGLVPRN